jgi:hypothetical protein
VSASATGAGVQNMIDRIARVGGQLHVTSAVAHGTRVCGTVPLAPATRRRSKLPLRACHISHLTPTAPAGHGTSSCHVRTPHRCARLCLAPVTPWDDRRTQGQRRPST